MSTNEPTPELRSGHFCYFVPIDAFVEGRGWRVSIVVENEPGHYPTGGGGKAPWFWGSERKDYKLAKETERAMNERIGLNERDVHRIISSSMGAQNVAERNRKLESWKKARQSGKE